MHAVLIKYCLNRIAKECGQVIHTIQINNNGKTKPQEEKFYNKFRLEENSCLGVISPQMKEALLLFVLHFAPEE